LTSVHGLLGPDLIRVTEAAAIAAAHTMGLGRRKYSDQVAVEAMRLELDRMPMSGRVVIGEGERDEAPMLYVGEELGLYKGGDGGLGVDIAVDPLEGTNLCATGAPGAITVLAASERGGLMHAPDVYMDKLVVGPSVKGKVHLDAPVTENLRNIARALDRDIEDLTIVVLDRERHAQLIADIREAGARIRLIGDGDLSAGIAAAVRGTGIHAVMGIGGAPEGVITAAAMRCLGGEIQARLRPLNDRQEARVAELGIADVDRLCSTQDLAPGDDIVLSSTAVTGDRLLPGVRFFGGGSRTSTLYMSLAQRTIRFVDTIRRDDESSPVMF
jgi:fructose-1,6-bisphosphatase II / sedoheptulose-1,7-bisphosphatase